jgi:hypothetical protein
MPRQKVTWVTLYLFIRLLPKLGTTGCVDQANPDAMRQWREDFLDSLVTLFLLFDKPTSHLFFEIALLFPIQHLAGSNI